MPQDLSDQVEPRLGTTQTRWIAFSSAALPFGMVNLSPDTKTDADWGGGYAWQHTTIKGFSHSHEWQIGALSVMPVDREDVDPRGGPAAIESPFSHDDEVVKPGYHKVVLRRYNVTAELTATTYVGISRYTFPADAKPALLIDLATQLGPSLMGEGQLKRVGPRKLEGYCTNLPTIRRPKPLRVYFAITFDTAGEVELFEGQASLGKVAVVNGQGVRGSIAFAAGTRQVVMRAALSHTSTEAAWANLEHDCGDSHDFDAFREKSRAIWNAWLGRVKVDGAEPETINRFYTDLYFMSLGRRTVSDAAGTYIDNTGSSPVVRRVSGPYRHFNSDAFWGAQWSITPAWSLVCPEILGEFCHCFMDYAQNGGLIPRGPAGGNYTFVMTSAQTTPLFVHSILSGIYRPDNVEEVYAALRKNHFPGGLMSKAGYEHTSNRGGGIEDYLAKGFIPEDLPQTGFHNKGAAQTVEHAYNDWALARLARKLGRSDDAKRFEDRAGQFRNVFDRELGMMRPRNRDGSWLTPYEPFSKTGWTEASGWSYTFYPAYDIDGLIDCFGSRDRFLEQLEWAMRESEKHGFKAPHDHHETVTFDFGNEPALAAPWLFHLAGKPERTQYWVSRIRELLRSGNRPTDGFGGDEDQGMMGAWDVLAAIGLFSPEGGCTAEPDYLVGRCAFERVEINAGPQPPITIVNRATAGRVVRARCQGKELPGLRVKRSDLPGGTLELLGS